MEDQFKVYTYRYLLLAAQRAYLRAEDEDRDSLIDCMEVILFAALSLEAFLNHLGPTLLRGWGPIKKKLSPREKLAVLLAERQVSIDFSCRPYQSFGDAFRLRTALAHAETEYLPFIRTDGERTTLPETDWQRTCNRETARRILEDTASIQRTLPVILCVNEDERGLLAESVNITDGP